MNPVSNVKIFYNDDDGDDDDVDDQRLAPTQKMARHDILQTHWCTLYRMMFFPSLKWYLGRLLKNDAASKLIWERDHSHYISHQEKEDFQESAKKKCSSLLALRIGPE